MWMPDFSKAPAYATKNINSWKERNEGYEVMLWDEESSRKIIPENRLEFFNRLDMPIKKADFARLEVLLKFGGAYFDCDLIPNNNLEYFFSKRFLERPKYDKDKKLSFDLIESSLCDKHMILTREWKDAFPKDVNIFSHVSRVANGVIFSDEGNRLIKEFLNRKHRKINDKVLKYLGPHAFTMFLHTVRKKIQKDELLIIPPHHFLWEKSVGKQPEWSISKHLGENTWGDHSKDDYWDI